MSTTLPPQALHQPQKLKPKQSKKKQSRRKSPLPELLTFDAKILETEAIGKTLIGLDEVGRGSLIDSVVGGAVCLPLCLSPAQKHLFRHLNDSKKLTPAIRAELSEAIHTLCLTGIGEASREEIEQLNIHYASLLAVYRAFETLCQRAEHPMPMSDCFLLMDGRALVPYHPKDQQKAVIKGDGLSAAIAAASVIAKHHRDTKMHTLALEYPHYGWEINMGYPTPHHLKALSKHGASPYHRKSFKSVREQLTLPLAPLYR